MGWLGDEPAKAVRDALQKILRDQVPDARLNWVRLQDAPYFLTGGRRSETDDTKVTVVRAGLAVGFELEVDDGAGNLEQLQGVFSWVAAGLDTQSDRVDRTFFDLGMDLQTASSALDSRIYEL